MSIRNVTASNDWTYGAGRQNFLTKNAAILLDVRLYLQLWMGNAFWALAAGVNYAQLLNKGTEKALLAALQGALMSRYGVVQVTQLSAVLDPETRALTATYTINTIYGQAFTNSITIPIGQANAQPA